MANQKFSVLDGIISSDYAMQTLVSSEEIQNYAESIGVHLSKVDAEKIKSVGLKWIERMDNGDWSFARHEAIEALEQ